MKTRAAAVLCGVYLLGMGLLSSCVSPPKATKSSWIVNGRVMGTILTTQTATGEELDYRDNLGRLVRIEKHGPDGRGLPGVCAYQYSYNADGALIMEQNQNASGLLACNSDGFAVEEYAYSYDGVGNSLVQQSFLDQYLRPVATKAGFAMIKTTKAPDGTVLRHQFFDAQGKPASATWDGVSGVADIQYTWLQGVTPVLCGVFRDGSGNIIERKQLAGETKASILVY
ncbi:MAG TPA: hypothetical protein VMA13_03090 [Candidatus Saccharimonadales bacterium]|nr:hypothetical protein [Candidatus Saccharimonadales bacterium]